MLRPSDVMNWYRARVKAGRNEISQLLDGVIPGGSIIVGGCEDNAQKLAPLLTARQRIGRIVPMCNAELRPEQCATFDTAAIVQLLMIQRNETFHETVDICIQEVQTSIDQGHSVEVALLALKAKADTIGKL